MTAPTRTERGKAAAAEREAAAQDQGGGEVATRDGGGVQAAPPDGLRDYLYSYKGEFSRGLPKTGVVDVEAFMRQALTGLRASKQAAQLAKCTRPSLLAALMEAARLGLMPFTDEAAIVPMGNQATFICMYQGYEQLFYRTGQIVAVEKGLIHQKDEWALAYGDNAGFYHRPLLVDPETGGRPDRGDPILAWCFLRYRDGNRTAVTTLTRWDAEDIRDGYSKAYRYAEQKRVETDGRRWTPSPWHTDFDKMWLKSAIRQHAKDAPKSPELVYLLAIERRDDTRADVADSAPPLWTPPAGPPQPENTGDAWQHDVNGAVPGDVVGEGRGEPADPDEDWDGATTERPGAAPPPAAQAAPAQAQPAQGQGREPDGDELVSKPTGGRLGAQFQAIGWSGDENAERRLVVACVLAIGQNAKVDPPVLDRPGQLTERQAKIALGMFGAERKAIRAEHGDWDEGQVNAEVAVRFQARYEAELARRAAAAAQAEAGAQDAAAEASQDGPQ